MIAEAASLITFHIVHRVLGRPIRRNRTGLFTLELM